jgi:excisionase family DNA binding protein
MTSNDVDDGHLPLDDIGGVAATFGVSRRTVWRWVARGEIGYRRIGRVIRFTREDVTEFIARSRVKAS